VVILALSTGVLPPTVAPSNMQMIKNGAQNPVQNVGAKV